MILRNQTRDKYVVISQNIMRDKNLPLKLKGLLCFMLSLNDGWDFSINGLCAVLPDGSRSIREGLKKLEELGYLKRNRIRNEKGQYIDVEWEVFETPQFQPQLHFAHVDIKHEDNAHVENVIQSNIKESNTKIINNQSNLFSMMRHEKIWTKEDLELNMSIYYDELDDNTKNVCDILLECMNAEQSYYTIGGARIASEALKSRLLRIDREDIEIISERITTSIKPIRNLKSYIIKSLYNEPATRDLYWANRVSVDFANK